MSAVFSGARAKIDRAREQTEALQADFKRFYDRKTYAIVQDLDPETGRKTATYRSTEQFPPVWPIIIGEIMHDLRSALDHTIYEITCIEGSSPLERTEFPVFEDEAMYQSSSKKGVPNKTSGLYKIRGINDSAKKIVRDLQPFEFRKSHPPNEHPIVALAHDLNIIDKHRTIHLCRRRTTEYRLVVIRDIQLPHWVLPVSILKEDMKLGDWTPVVHDDQPDIDIEIDFEIAFGATLPALEGEAVIQTCERLAVGVERIIFDLLKGTLTT